MHTYIYTYIELYLYLSPSLSSPIDHLFQRLSGHTLQATGNPNIRGDARSQAMLDLEVRIRCSMPTSDLAMLDAD